MNTIKTTLTTEAIFSDDGKKRYLLRKTWDDAKPKLSIIMLAPSEASGIELDRTTQLVLNNTSRLGYGSVTIANLFADLHDSDLKQVEENDSENLNAICKAAEGSDIIIYAPGVGKARNRMFTVRQEKALQKLLPFEKKLHCLCDEDGNARLQHPLSPAVRTWHLSPLKIKELIPELGTTKEKPKNSGKKQ